MCVSNESLYEVSLCEVSMCECFVSLCVYNTNMQQQNDIATPTTAKNNKNILTAIVIIYYRYIYISHDSYRHMH